MHVCLISGTSCIVHPSHQKHHCYMHGYKSAVRLPVHLMQAAAGVPQCWQQQEVAQSLAAKPNSLQPQPAAVMLGYTSWLTTMAGVWRRCHQRRSHNQQQQAQQRLRRHPQASRSRSSKRNLQKVSMRGFVVQPFSGRHMLYTKGHGLLVVGQPFCVLLSNPHRCTPQLQLGQLSCSSAGRHTNAMQP